MGLENRLIPARFFSSLIHFICILLIFSEIVASIFSSSKCVLSYYFIQDSITANSKQKAKLIFIHIISNATRHSLFYSLLSAAWMSLILIIIEFVGLFGTFTLFHHNSNMMLITLHSIGAVMTGIFVGLSLEYWSYWFIFIVCSLIPGVLETINIIKIIVCQTRKY